VSVWGYPCRPGRRTVVTRRVAPPTEPTIRKVNDMPGYGPYDPGHARHRSIDPTASTVRATARVAGTSTSAAPAARGASQWWQDAVRDPAGPSHRPEAARRHDVSDRSHWLWLLLIPALLPLLTPVYNRIEPRLAGVPFFYWFQLALVGLDIVVVTVVYQATKRRGRS